MRKINTLLHVIVYLSILLFGPYSIYDLAVVGVCFIFCWAVGEVTYRKLVGARDRHILGMVNSVIILYWCAYLLKFGIGIFFADQYWVVPEITSGTTLVDNFPFGYAVTTVGYVSLMAAVLLYPSRGPKSVADSRLHFRLRVAVVSVSVALVAKYYLKARFGLGNPNEEPEYLGVPYLSGIVTLVIQSGFIFMSNIVLFYGLWKPNAKVALVGIVLSFANAFMDLRFGSKNTIVYQIAIPIMYILILYTRGGPKRPEFRRVAATVGAVLLVAGSFVMGVYKYVNVFRSALVGGYSVESAISLAASNAHARNVSSVMEIYNRITGLETLAGMLPLRGVITQKTGFMAMFDGSLVDAFTYELLQTSDALTKFSVTQFGYFYFTGGFIGLIFGCALLGITFRVAQQLVMLAPVSAAMKVAFLPTLWILFIKALLGGGNMGLWLKELAVVLLFFLFVSHLACAREHRRYVRFGWRHFGASPAQVAQGAEP